MPSRLHEALIEHALHDHLVGHLSRDSTAIEGREKPTPKPPQPAKPKRKRGRPRKDEQRPPKQPRRLERQPDMSLPEMIADLPRACDVGTKRNAKGHQESWIGYKLHIDAADGGIPVSCILSSASLHDSQVAIPLATMSNARITNLYDLMDSAYDATEIREYSEALGHVAIIDDNPRRDAVRKQALLTEAQAQRAVDYVYPPTCATGSARPSSGSTAGSRTNSVAATSAYAVTPSAVPLDVRRPGADRGPIAAHAELTPTSFPHELSCRDSGSTRHPPVCPRTHREPHRLRIPATMRCRKPIAAASGALPHTSPQRFHRVATDKRLRPGRIEGVLQVARHSPFFFSIDILSIEIPLDMFCAICYDPELR